MVLFLKQEKDILKMTNIFKFLNAIWKHDDTAAIAYGIKSLTALTSVGDATHTNNIYTYSKREYLLCNLSSSLKR